MTKAIVMGVLSVQWNVAFFIILTCILGPKSQKHGIVSASSPYLHFGAKIRATAAIL